MNQSKVWQGVIALLLLMGLYAPNVFGNLYEEFSDVYSDGGSKSDISGNVNLFIGAKALSEDWSPVDAQSEFGLKLDIEDIETDYLSLKCAVDLLFSRDSATDDSSGYQLFGNSREINIGVRWYSDSSGHGFFLGGGTSIISGQVEKVVSGLKVDNYGAGIGNWFELGVSLNVVSDISIGMNIIISEGFIDTDSGRIDAGGAHCGYLLGIAF